MKNQPTIPLFILVFLVLMAIAPVQQAQAAPVAPGFSVTVAPTALVPGQAGVVFVSGGYPLEVSVTLGQDPLAVYWTGEGYLALFAFGFDAAAGDYSLAIRVSDPATGRQLVHEETLTINEFSYPAEQVSISGQLAPLLDPVLNQRETAYLETIYAAHSHSTDWGWPFAIPVPGERMTSRFGGDRSYNGGVWRSYHTGIDLQRGVGEPIYATTSGRVVAAEMLDVRGNVVILDHGYGVFSLYGHCSQVFVALGQSVQRGQLIAAAGATGRTNGAHLHFEIVVNGIPVDPIQWLALAPGFIPPEEVPRERDEPIEEGTGH